MIAVMLPDLQELSSLVSFAHRKEKKISPIQHLHCLDALDQIRRLSVLVNAPSPNHPLAEEQHTFSPMAYAVELVWVPGTSVMMEQSATRNRLVP